MSEPASHTLDPNWRSAHGRAPGLEGVSGRIALKVADEMVGVLNIEGGGSVSVDKGDSAATTIQVQDDETLAGILSGDEPPVVAFLQGKLRVTGDPELVIHTLFGLQAGSPWSTHEEKRA